MFDTIIRNARIVDGSGAPWFEADLAVADGKIAKIGNLAGHDAYNVVVADGKVLCPGFIEIHGHSDATLLINPLAESSVHLGVTTECTGNCGSSLFPVTRLTEPQILNHFTAFVPDYEINWSDLAQLKDKYESQGIAVNIVPLIGHNVVRAAVKGSDMSPSTPDERQRMAELVEEALDQGARGFSSGLEYPPRQRRRPGGTGRSDRPSGNLSRSLCDSHSQPGPALFGSDSRGPDHRSPQRGCGSDLS